MEDPDKENTKSAEEWKEESLKYRKKKLSKEEREERVKARIAELKAQ